MLFYYIFSSLKDSYFLQSPWFITTRRWSIGVKARTLKEAFRGRRIDVCVQPGKFRLITRRYTVAIEGGRREKNWASRPPKSELLIRWTESKAVGNVGAASWNGVERKTRRRWSDDDDDGDGDDDSEDEEDPDEARHDIKGRKEEAERELDERDEPAKERKRSWRTRSDRDVRSDLVGESNLAK